MEASEDNARRIDRFLNALESEERSEGIVDGDLETALMRGGFLESSATIDRRSLVRIPNVRGFLSSARFTRDRRCSLRLTRSRFSSVDTDGHL